LEICGKIDQIFANQQRKEVIAKNDQQETALESAKIGQNES
jgi:hypothetical protein